MVREIISCPDTSLEAAIQKEVAHLLETVLLSFLAWLMQGFVVPAGNLLLMACLQSLNTYC